MMALVNKEYLFCFLMFKPTLLEILARKNYNKDWSNNFKRFKSLLDILEHDLHYFLYIIIHLTYNQKPIN